MKFNDSTILGGLTPDTYIRESYHKTNDTIKFSGHQVIISENLIKSVKI